MPRYILQHVMKNYDPLPNRLAAGVECGMVSYAVATDPLNSNLPLIQRCMVGSAKERERGPDTFESEAADSSGHMGSLGSNDPGIKPLSIADHCCFGGSQSWTK